MEIGRISVIFKGELPERVQLDCVSYRVRPFEAAPLKEYGHTAAVCRAKPRCGSCGNADCAGRMCEKEQSKPMCLHCKGDHHAGSVNCPRRVREVKVKQIVKQG